MPSLEEPVCIAPAADVCGEGPLWHPTEQALYWTDINRFLIHRFDVATSAVQTWFFDEPVTALALTRDDNTLAVALASKVIFWKPRSGAARDSGFCLRNSPAVRLNDGRVDPRGAFWVGSMRNNVASNGSSFEAGGTDGILYRLEWNGPATEWKWDIGISNTLAWSPDASLFYFADSLANAVYRFDYDSESGAIANQQPFFLDHPRGMPDGSAIDSDGYLWNCRYGGSCILRIAPDGTLDRTLEMPTANVTSCTFGGPDLQTLYITTARAGLPDHDRLAGGIFAFHAPVPGLPENRMHHRW